MRKRIFLYLALLISAVLYFHGQKPQPSGYGWVWPFKYSAEMGTSGFSPGGAPFLVSQKFPLDLKELSSSAMAPGAEKIKNNHDSYIGETIIYDVKFGLIKLGQATFKHLADRELEGRRASFMTFETKLAGFDDLEEIYSDPESLLPLQVRRDIKGWKFNEKITENYDQKKFILTIIKKKGGRTGEMKISVKGPIHNAIVLPFYLRRVPELKIGWSFAARLPVEFQMQLISIEDVNIRAGTFRAYHFVSSPGKFDIWISADERRIPLKIRSMGNTMTMRDYSRLP